MALIRLDGMKVRERRAELGLSRDQLALASEVGRVTLWKIEDDVSPNGCNLHVARALAQALGVPLEALLP